MSDPEAGYGSIEPEAKTEPRPSRRRLVLAAAVAAIVFAAAGGVQVTGAVSTDNTAYGLYGGYGINEEGGFDGGVAAASSTTLEAAGAAGTDGEDGSAFGGLTDTSSMTNLAQSVGGGGADGGLNVNVGTNSKSSSLPADGPTLLGAASDTFDCNNSCFCDWSTGQEPRYSYFCNQARRLTSLIVNSMYSIPIQAITNQYDNPNTIRGINSDATTSLWRKLTNFIYIGPQQQSNPDGGGPGCQTLPLDSKCATQPTTREAVTASVTTVGGGTGHLGRGYENLEDFQSRGR